MRAAGSAICAGFPAGACLPQAGAKNLLDYCGVYVLGRVLSAGAARHFALMPADVSCSRWVLSRKSAKNFPRMVKLNS